MEQENQQAEQTFRPRERRQPRHFWADNEIVSNYLPQIGVYGFSVYMLLCYHANAKTGKAFPSIATMAKKLEVSEPTIRSALEKLQKAKLIQISRRTKMSKNGKEVPTNNYYTLLTVRKNKQGVVNQVDQGGKPHLPGVVNQVSPNNTKYNKTQGTISLSNDSDLWRSGEPPRTPHSEAEAPNGTAEHVADTGKMSVPQSSLENPNLNIPPLVKNDANSALRAEMGKLLSERNPVSTVAPPTTVDGYGPRAALPALATGYRWRHMGGEWRNSADFFKYGAADRYISHICPGKGFIPLCKAATKNGYEDSEFQKKDGTWRTEHSLFAACPDCQRVYAERTAPKPKVELAPRKPNPAFDAIAKYMFKLDKTPKNGGAIGTMINAIKDCLDEKHHATLGQDLTNAFAWWTSKPVPNSPNGETYNAPGTALKVCRMLADWREAGSPAAPAETDEVWGLVDDPKNPGFQMYGWVKKGGA